MNIFSKIEWLLCTELQWSVDSLILIEMNPVLINWFVFELANAPLNILYFI